MPRAKMRNPSSTSARRLFAGPRVYAVEVRVTLLLAVRVKLTAVMPAGTNGVVKDALFHEPVAGNTGLVVQ